MLKKAAGILAGFVIQILFAVVFGGIVVGTFLWFHARVAFEYNGLSIFQFWGIGVAFFVALVFIVPLAVLLVYFIPDSWKNRVLLIRTRISHISAILYGIARPYLAAIRKVIGGIYYFYMNIVLFKITPLLFAALFFYAGVMGLVGARWLAALIGFVFASVAFLLFFKAKPLIKWLKDKDDAFWRKFGIQ